MEEDVGQTEQGLPEEGEARAEMKAGVTKAKTKAGGARE